MVQTIWKVALKFEDVQEIEVPEGAKLLYVGEQHGQIYVWFCCDPEAPCVQRKVAIVGTGAIVPTDGRYLGTVLLHGGSYVFHVFE